MQCHNSFLLFDGVAPVYDSRIAFRLYLWTEAMDDGVWDLSTERTVLSYFTVIDQASLTAIQTVAPRLHYGRSETAGATYLANHCTHCGVLQGDWFLNESREVFFPSGKSELQDFKVDRLNQSLEIDAWWIWSGWHGWIELRNVPLATCQGCYSRVQLALAVTRRNRAGWTEWLVPKAGKSVLSLRGQPMPSRTIAASD